jgi:hypothetical protein
VVSADDERRGDLLIEDGRIAAISIAGQGVLL